jgi:methyl-accepting chemotaxis protein
MNAAIESAHAGSAGAGFAVVASEIKKLAESTRRNAKDIQDAIKAVNRHIKDALNASETASETLGSISGGIRSFTESLASINEEVQRSGAADGEAEAVIKESAAILKKIQDGGMDIMAHHQSFRSALEQIHALAGESRTELKEIHTGTREVLENIVKTQNTIRETLDETGSLGKALDGPAAGGPKSSPSAILPAQTGQKALPPSPPAVTLPARAAPPLASTAPAQTTTAPARTTTAPVQTTTAPAQTSACITKPAAEAAPPPKLPFEADNSWRKDVAVKSPPQTIW